MAGGVAVAQGLVACLGDLGQVLIQHGFVRGRLGQARLQRRLLGLERLFAGAGRVQLRRAAAQGLHGPREQHLRLVEGGGDGV